MRKLKLQRASPRACFGISSRPLRCLGSPSLSLPLFRLGWYEKLLTDDGITGLTRAIAKTEGVGALWRGIGPTLVGVIPARFVPSLASTQHLDAKRALLNVSLRVPLQFDTVLHLRKRETHPGRELQRWKRSFLGPSASCCKCRFVL
jgi:hypothetical protein